MISAIAQGLFISGLSWLTKLAYSEAGRMWQSAKQHVAALEGKDIEKDEKAARVVAMLATILPDSYEGPARVIFRILIDCAIVYVRFTSQPRP